VSDDLRPIEGDPGAAEAESFMDLGSERWWLTAEGDYATSAGETMRYDGSNWQRVVMLQWPARLNKSDAAAPLRLLMSPEDAIGLAQVLVHTAGWMLGPE